MVKAGVLMAGEGLRPTALGARVRFLGGGKRPQVIDGPFTESKELIAGFSIIQVRSKAEAIEWALRRIARGEVVVLEDLPDLQLPARGGRRAHEKRRQEYARKLEPRRTLRLDRARDRATAQAWGVTAV